jgi:6-pyruvoyltetrahydropterin/6-carboxytetrahydropterin synthase
MTRLTRRYRFSASHRLHCESMSESANTELYGKCNNPFGHGHNYILEVTVRGPVDSHTGRVANIGELDGYIDRKVIRYLDHRDMNRDISDFEKMVATTENLSRVIEGRLREEWNGLSGSPALDTVRIQETKRNIFEIRDL